MSKSISYYQKSREKWKAKSHIRWEEIRRQETIIRDIQESRAMWKSRTKALELELKALKKTLS